MVFSRLEFVMKQKNIAINSLSEAIGLTRQGFDYRLKAGSLTIEQLEKLSKALDVPMSYWFGEEPTVMPGKTLEQKYIEALEEIRDLHRELKNMPK